MTIKTFDESDATSCVNHAMYLSIIIPTDHPFSALLPSSVIVTAQQYHSLTTQS